MTDASTHLSFDDLVAVAGRPDSPQRPHLEECADCRAELERWRTVARGVRDAAPPEPPRAEVLRGVLAAVDGAGAPRPAARRTRRAVLLSAAAAAVVAGAATYGLWPGDDSTGSPQATGTFSAQQVASMGLLTTDCKDLKVAAGTLRSVHGTHLVVETEKGKTVEVDASASPKVTRQVAGRVSDLAAGTTVIVRGKGDQAGKSVTANTVVVGSAAMKLPKLPKLPGGMKLDMTSMMASRGTVLGTVSGADADGFTVTGSDGTRVRVATPASTKMIKQQRARLDQLETGKYTVVVGTLHKDGTLRATTVQQDALTNGAKPSLPNGFTMPEGFASGGPKSLPAMPGGKDLFSGLGCDSDAIANSAVNGTAL
ncbi:hypothetical protein BTM25_00230 [Actinomadura rubteroloni]|uniref:DUF5666 domain-containing protein n=1 Tax=Actinomadura rubteroloni TaxID=1926885 RepID=A0A2P4UKR2_9ACTN|nr:hypothetical protein [Actinomadura rubteroloni]POM25641.1 hypothetical protein BTM25_00230 [Actinomadura rubteroloni]